MAMVRIADSHSDYLAYRVIGTQGVHLYNQSGIEKMQHGGVALQNLAIWSPSDARDCVACSLCEVSFFYHMLSCFPSQVHLCTLPEHFNLPGIGFILSIESGESIGCHAELIPQFYNWGVRILSLTWNAENAFASGALCEGGIKPAGIEALHTMNELSMALDVSHLNEQSFWEALSEYSGAPCATHSCVYDICPNTRNLQKEQIEAIIERDGYIGVNFFTEFLTGRGATVENVLDHIDYMLKCGGEDAVGLGSDFCGISSAPDGLLTASDFQNIPIAMEKRGYQPELIEKICYGNFARYILQFLKRDTDEDI
jgi:membrane dipeptidase